VRGERGGGCRSRREQPQPDGGSDQMMQRIDGEELTEEGAGERAAVVQAVQRAAEPPSSQTLQGRQEGCAVSV
jgi:hypothetical protein